jgi:hypothetical protein
MDLSNLDKLFIERELGTRVLETNKDNTFIGRHDLSNQGFNISRNPIYEVIESEEEFDVWEDRVVSLKHCPQCLYVDCKVHI